MWCVFCLLEWQSFWTSSSTLETQLSRWNNFLILPVPKCSVVFQMSSLKCINIYIFFYFTSSKKHYFSHFSPTKSSCTFLQMWNKVKDRMGKRARALAHRKKLESFHPWLSEVIEAVWGRCGVRRDQHFLLWVRHRMAHMKQGVGEELPPSAEVLSSQGQSARSTRC